MTYIDTNLRPRVLIRVWLQTTDRNAPLRSVWITTPEQPSIATHRTPFPIETGGEPLCA